MRRTSATDVDALLAMGAEHAAFERAAFDAEADALASRRAGLCAALGGGLAVAADERTCRTWARARMKRDRCMRHIDKTGFMVIIHRMKLAQSALAFSALGHEARLEVFRVLVRAGHDGLSVGDIATHFEQPPSTLAHHLRTLVRAGLVVQERQGRLVLCRADFGAVLRAATFLTAECCSGVTLVRHDAG